MRRTIKLISGGTPRRTGAPTVPKPRFTNLDAADLVVEALRGETVHGTEERSSSGSRGGGAEEVAGAALGATAIEAVLGVRSAKRECAISYVLGLDR